MKMSPFTPLYALFLITFLFGNSKCEIFTAVADLEELVHTETHLLHTLNNYIEAEEERLSLLGSYAEMYQEEHDKASKDVSLYIANPINAFTLVKRLTTDWKQVENLITTVMSEEYVANITRIKETMTVPTNEDLNGAALALIRLQDTYNLDTSSLANGELNGVKYSSELSAADCFELGRQCNNSGDYYHTQLWMREADKRRDEEIYETVERTEILEYLAFATYKRGNLSSALDLTNELLEISPSHPQALKNKAYYEDELRRVADGSNPMKGRDINYERLCRGEISLDSEQSAKLKCRYFRPASNPFLLLAPFKVEEAYHDPEIFIYHDVLSDNEIDTIKRLAQPKFRRATVVNSETGEPEAAPYRIGKSAWLMDEDHKHVADVSQRVADMTGLTVTTAEQLQVVNYGIGGHYDTHYDFAKKNEPNTFQELGTGNRIATVLFYMSDVAQGGATVFPEIQVAVWPKKGAAAFWYNLHRNGDGDTRTKHAACPVLAGYKWICNKWMHEKGQEFLRPCTLELPAEDAVA